MNPPGLFSLNLLAGLTPTFYPNRITIQVKTESRGTMGSVIEDWDDVPEWADLPCATAPQYAMSERGATERRQPQQTVATDLLVASIPQYLPTIRADLHRALLDGVAWNIAGVEWDSHHVMTRLALEKVSR